MGKYKIELHLMRLFMQVRRAFEFIDYFGLLAFVAGLVGSSHPLF